MRNSTPVIVGVGQIVERLDATDYEGLTAVELAARAVELAIADAGADIVPSLDAMTVIRTFPDSVPKAVQPVLAPFGWPDNFAGCIADRLNISGAEVNHSGACGNEPQKWVGIFGSRIASGEIRAAVICGAEAIATMRKAKAEGQSWDWTQHSDYPVNDPGMNTDFMTETELQRHGGAVPVSVYPLLEQARRLSLGLSSEDYALQMGALFAPFTEVAASNPYAMSQKTLSATEIATITERNRMVGDPHPKSVVARDWVNQGAAVVIVSSALADSLGIADDRRVYVHGYADTVEKVVLERPDLGVSPAMHSAYDVALAAAGKTFADMRYVDCYSCFPIAVFNALDYFGLPLNGDVPYTLTGGLPYFGGPGNNYSMHGIAEAVACARADRGAFALVGANGGYMSKHSVGIYSTEPCGWPENSNSRAQTELDAIGSVSLDLEPAGQYNLETYTVIYRGDQPQVAIAIGRSAATGHRAIAVSPDPDVMQRMGELALGAQIAVNVGQPVNTFSIV